MHLAYSDNLCLPRKQLAYEATFDSIMKCDHLMRKEMFGNIVLAGENSLFPGFERRMLTLFHPQERKYSAWPGGSIFSALSSFANVLMSKEE